MTKFWGSAQMYGLFILALFAVGVFGVQAGWFSALGAGTGTQPGGQGTGEQPIAVAGCSGVAGVAYKVITEDKFAPNVPRTVETVIYEKMGSALTLVADTNKAQHSQNTAGTAITFTPKRDHEFFVFDDGQTTAVDGQAIGLDASNDWYGAKGMFNASDCLDGTVKVQTAKEGSLTVTVTNSNGKTVNASGAQEDLSAGDTVDLTVDIKANSDKAYGAIDPANTQNLVMALDYNLTVYESFKITDDGADNEYGIPGQYAGTVEDAILLPTTSLEDGGKASYNLQVKVDTGITVTDAGSDVTGYILDGALFKTTENELEWGVENDSDSDIGASNASFTIYVS